MIGQNLADITHPEFSSNITDSLKPSLIVSTSLADECVISQHKQFFVKLKPSVSYSTSPSHCVSWLSHSLSLSLSLSLTLSSLPSPSYLLLSPSIHEYDAWKRMHIKSCVVSG